MSAATPRGIEVYAWCMQTMGLAVAGNRYDLTGLDDSALLAGTRRLIGTSNQVFADLLAHLAEVEARGIHRLRACSSLYTYCIYELRLSEDAAFRRVSAARLVKRFPALFEAIAAGELHLTGLLMVGPHLTESNYLQVLARAKHRTKRELTTLIRQIDPLPNVPTRIEPLGPAEQAPRAVRAPTWEESARALNPVRNLSPGERPRDWMEDEATTASDSPQQPRLAIPSEDSAVEVEHPLAWPIQPPQRYAVQFTATEEYAMLVERAKALLSQTSQGCSVVEIHLRALRALVAQLEKRKYGTIRSRNDPRQRGTDEPSPRQRDDDTSDPCQRGKADANPPRTRHIPASIRREVFTRDGARCTYVDPTGQRCHETLWLELHHRQPFALLGPHTAENLTLHCRAHNALCAEQDFGATCYAPRSPSTRRRR